MKKFLTYPLQLNSDIDSILYTKLLTINGRYIEKENNYAVVNIKLIDYDNFSISDQLINIIMSNKEINFTFNGFQTDIPLVVTFSPKEWDKHESYTLGESVFYKGDVYTVINIPSKGIVPSEDATIYKIEQKYTSDSNYLKFDTVLFTDGKYYTAQENITTSDIPGQSDKWLLTKGEYTLWAGTYSTNSQFECKVISGSPNMMNFYPYNGQYQCLDINNSIKVNEIDVSYPRICSLDYKTTYGMVCQNQLLPDKKSKQGITIPTINIDKYIPIIKFTVTGDVNASLDVTISNMTKNIYDITGIFNITFRGGTSYLDIKMKTIFASPTFNSDFLDIYCIKKTSNVYVIYIKNYIDNEYYSSNQYKINISNLQLININNENTFITKCVSIDTLSYQTEEDSYTGEIVNNLFGSYSEMFDGSKVFPSTDSTTLIINYDTNIPNKLILSSDKQYDYAYFDINLMQGTYEFTYLGDNENYYPDYSIKNNDGSVDLEKENNIIIVKKDSQYTFRFYATGDNPGTTTYQNISLKRIN